MESGTEEEEDLPAPSSLCTTWRAGTKRRVGVYTRGRHSLNLAVETLALTKSQISDQDGRRQGRKGFRESEAEGGLEERQGWTPVPRWKVRCCNL